jgi:hypothetical protein
MRRAWEKGKPADSGRARRQIWAGTLCIASLVLMAFAGCQATNETRAKPHDPLMGEKEPEKTYGVAGLPPPPQNRAQMNPPAPPAIASKSNAAMVYPDPEPLPGARNPLAIADAQKQPTAPQQLGTWQPKSNINLTGGQSGPGVLLKQPEQTITPVPPPTFAPNVVPTPQPLPAATQVNFTDNDQLQAALKQRGVIWQDQKVLADGVHFACGVANPQEPDFSHTYETVAPDYRAAVIAVLEQIDRK